MRLARGGRPHSPLRSYPKNPRWTGPRGLDEAGSDCDSGERAKGPTPGRVSNVELRPSGHDSLGTSQSSLGELSAIHIHGLQTVSDAWHQVPKERGTPDSGAACDDTKKSPMQRGMTQACKAASAGSALPILRLTRCTLAGECVQTRGLIPIQSAKPSAAFERALQ